MPASSACSCSGWVASSSRSRARSARSLSACELTETYSPAAMERAPATIPASPASRIGPRVACAAATPTTRLLVEISPSLAPSTAARSQPTCPVRWSSGCVATAVVRVRLFLPTLRRALQPILQGARGTATHLGRDFLGGGALGLDPAPPAHVEHRRQATHAYPRVNADVGIERDDDLGSLVALETLAL